MRAGGSSRRGRGRESRRGSVRSGRSFPMSTPRLVVHSRASGEYVLRLLVNLASLSNCNDAGFSPSRQCAHPTASRPVSQRCRTRRLHSADGADGRRRPASFSGERSPATPGTRTATFSSRARQHDVGDGPLPRPRSVLSARSRRSPGGIPIEQDTVGEEVLHADGPNPTARIRGLRPVSAHERSESASGESVSGESESCGAASARV
jgi:hypothetical protein